MYKYIHIYYVYTYTYMYAHTGTYRISAVYDQDVHTIPMVCRSRYMDEPSDRSTGEVEQEEEADEQETSKEMQAAWVPMAISHTGAIEQVHI